MQKRKTIFRWLACFSLLVFPSCIKHHNQAPPAVSGNPVPVTYNIKNISYLALGDSYTIGQSVTGQERFPYQLSQLLGNAGLVVNKLSYIAASGWSTLALQNAVAHAEPLDSFDMVTLLIGVNDQFQGLDTAGYRVRFTQLLNKAVSLVKGNTKHVFVLSIPDYSATPYVSEAYKERVRGEIGAFNAINKQITLQNNIRYTDITVLTKEVTTNPALLAGDGLHYAAEEYYKWAELLAQSVYPAFQ